MKRKESGTTKTIEAAKGRGEEDWSNTGDESESCPTFATFEAKDNQSLLGKSRQRFDLRERK